MLIENIKLALISLKANKMRSLLTMLGIIIGIGSVITIVTLGDSLSGSVNSSMQGLGAGNVYVNVIPRTDATDEYVIDDQIRPLTDEDMVSEAMLNDYKNKFKNEIELISITQDLAQLTLNNQRLHADVSLRGISNKYELISNDKLIVGRFLNEDDVLNNQHYAVVNKEFVKEYFGINQDFASVLNRKIDFEINNQIYSLSIIGVYQKGESQSSLFSFDMGEGDRTTIYLPYTTVFKILNYPQKFTSFTVVPQKGVDALAFKENTNAYFQSFYSLDSAYVAKANSSQSMVDTMNDIINKIKLGISAIAAISLLVGGIGVMNIMMVSVTERTKEIGIRMALGAKRKVIRTQFIIEAVIVSLIGGLIGVIIGVSFGAIGAKLLQFSVKPSLSAIAIAVLFSMAIGIFFGYYPASKASKLNPIDALRYE